jgi:alpha-galactosidase/6-phospho-beta-glucosidase family protein
MSSTQMLIDLARSLPGREGQTHWDGCEAVHRECLIRKLADAAEAWMLAAQRYQIEKTTLAQAREQDEDLLLRALNALNVASSTADLPPLCDEVIAELSDRLEDRV